jgi:predicted alpha/beta-hydrolase family hydrolase
MSEKNVRINSGDVELDGDLTIPAGAASLVIFAHGSGSSRKSPRNRYVAGILQKYGIATLLFDLLTAEEDSYDSITGNLRFNIDLLTERLMSATDLMKSDKELGKLPFGYFGASTGAAAALVACSLQGSLIRAVVSRGGRPDLALKHLSNVRAPTLLIIGGRDAVVIKMNEEAYKELKTEKKIEIVPGATHLFEEKGAIEEVARLAAEWFVNYLKPAGKEH